jgi:hypothetical protein
MAVNPLVAQGNLNRLRGSVVIPSYPSLNVTASYLSKRGVGMELVGDLTQFLETMTGHSTSPEPYVPADITISILKTQNLSALWIAQVQDTTVLGNVTVHTDTAAFPHFDFQNVAVTRINRFAFDGTDPTMEVTMRGIYILNQSLWALA